MPDPFPLLVDDDKDRQEERQLYVSADGPAPEEAPVIGRLEPRVDVADHEQLSPPVVLTIIKHEVCRVPNRPSTQVREDGPATEGDREGVQEDFRCLLQLS